jgi:hypothetical protein
MSDNKIERLEATVERLRESVKKAIYYSNEVSPRATTAIFEVLTQALAATPEVNVRAIEERTTVRVLEWVSEMCRIADIPRAPEYFKYEAERRAKAHREG